MSPQFVDFNADGHTDIVAGTFSGSPFVALGTADGFAQPEMILDRDGARIVLNMLWNFDTSKWEETERCDPEGGAPAHGQLTSAWAVDWDRDGDHDLLLGDYDNGYLYLRENEGSDAAPAFATTNMLVSAGGKPVHAGKMSTPRMLDYDGDGQLDLLVGSMGDSYGDEIGGGVFVYPAIADGRTRRLGAPITLLPASQKGATTLTRPDSGLYMDLADHDGDGDLDLIVGAYSMWSPPAPELTAEQRALVAKLQAEQKELTELSRQLNEEVYAGLDPLDPEASKKKRSERIAAQTEQRRHISKRGLELRAQLQPLVPGQQRKSFVWLYENRSTTGGGTGADERESRR